jgi:hypothetical protein
MSCWRANDIYVVRLKDNGGAWGWAGEAVASTTARKAAQIALVYKGGEYYFFADGQKLAQLDKAKINSLAGIGSTDNTVKVGFAVNWSGGTAFSNWGCTTDANAIKAYFPTMVEKPAFGTEVYDATMAENNGAITYTANEYGAKTFNGVELAQGTNFVLYATVEAGMTAGNVGFVIGTFESTNNFLMFQWRKSQKDFYVYREKFGWAGHADGVFPSDIGTNGAKIALVCSDSTYYVFLNGSLVCSFGSTFDNGWGGNVNVASQIGTTGTLKIGLSVAFGSATFSDWGYSTDPKAIAEYVK